MSRIQLTLYYDMHSTFVPVIWILIGKIQRHYYYTDILEKYNFIEVISTPAITTNRQWIKQNFAMLDTSIKVTQKVKKSELTKEFILTKIYEAFPEYMI